MHLAIEEAPSYLDDIDTRDTVHGTLPEHRDDYDWGRIEDPDGEANQRIAMRDLRAAAWFQPCGYPDARDPGRGFRR